MELKERSSRQLPLEAEEVALSCLKAKIDFRENPTHVYDKRDTSDVMRDSMGLSGHGDRAHPPIHIARGYGRTHKNGQFSKNNLIFCSER